MVDRVVTDSRYYIMRMPDPAQVREVRHGHDPLKRVDKEWKGYTTYIPRPKLAEFPKRQILQTAVLRARSKLSATPTSPFSPLIGPDKCTCHHRIGLDESRHIIGSKFDSHSASGRVSNCLIRQWVGAGEPLYPDAVQNLHW